MMMKIKFEVRQDGKYRATCKTYDEAMALVEKGEFPIDNGPFGGPVSILKITTEKVWGRNG
jgi:hypothetical protein